MTTLKEHMKKSELVRCENVCKSLNKRGFKAFACNSKEKAVNNIIDLVKDSKTIGIPGSVTVREIGLLSELEKLNVNVYQHWDPNLTPDKVNQRFLDANSADWYITGCNAVTLDGQLVNIDGKGNRISAMVWAPGKIIYVMGVNKICPDIDGAIKRIKNEAVPPNSTRVNMAPPCVEVGRCVDCNSPERGCRVTAIMDYPPFGRECYVFLIAEELGY